MKHIKKFNENVLNKNSDTALKIVEVDYNGKKMKAISIGFASGPYYTEKYFLLDSEEGFDNPDFDSVTQIDPKDLLI